MSAPSSSSSSSSSSPLPNGKPSPRSVAIVPVAIREGQRRQGVELGPQFLLSTLGLPAKLADLGYSVTVDTTLATHDAPALVALAAATATDRSPASLTYDAAPAGTLHHAEYISGACRALAEISARNARSGALVLTLGGDHSLGLGSVAGTMRAHAPRDVALIWVDAHADINTCATTFSGNVHGCPVAFLLGKTHGVPADLGWLRADAPASALRADQVVFIGLRDVEDGERATLRALGIRCFSMADVDGLGIARVVRDALAHVDPRGDRAIHLSFDIDSLDPAHAPATGTAVPGGLSLREGRYICEQVAATGRLAAMDLVEVNPLLPSAQPSAQPTADALRTGESAVTMILAALGKTLL